MATSHLSPLREHDGFVFVSGQLAFDSERNIVGEDVGSQTRQCLANMAKLLNGVGLDLSDVIKTTVWLVRTEDFPAFNAAYAPHFPQNPPARATVRADLMAPGALVEIDAVAARRT